MASTVLMIGYFSPDEEQLCALPLITTSFPDRWPVVSKARLFVLYMGVQLFG
jgi:hypothetical protein